MSKKTTWALSGLSLSMLLPSLDTSIANVGLPTLAQSFSATFHQAGRRRMLLAGILIFTIASVLCGLAPTLPLLIAARSVQGIGAALMIALTLALAKESVPPEKPAARSASSARCRPSAPRSVRRSAAC